MQAFRLQVGYSARSMRTLGKTRMGREAQGVKGRVESSELPPTSWGSPIGFSRMTMRSARASGFAGVARG